MMNETTLANAAKDSVIEASLKKENCDLSIMLPDAILIDRICPYLGPLDTLMGLGFTSKYFYQVCTSDAVWKVFLEFNSNSQLAANAARWKQAMDKRRTTFEGEFDSFNNTVLQERAAKYKQASLSSASYFEAYKRLHTLPWPVKMTDMWMEPSGRVQWRVWCRRRTCREVSELSCAWPGCMMSACDDSKCQNVGSNEEELYENCFAMCKWCRVRLCHVYHARELIKDCCCSCKRGECIDCQEHLGLSNSSSHARRPCNGVCAGYQTNLRWGTKANTLSGPRRYCWRCMYKPQQDDETGMLEVAKVSSHKEFVALNDVYCKKCAQEEVEMLNRARVGWSR